MKTWSKLLVLALVLALALAILPPARPARAAGSISLAAFGTAYTQDFDTLASSGTTNTAVPAGWAFSESGTNANSTYRAGTGSDNAGDTYSFGAAGSTERAFGGLRSGSLVPLVGAQFTNDTGGTVNSLAISYTGEQWRLGQNTTGRSADRLDLQLSTDATSLTTGAWTDYDALDFSSPVVAGTVGALNGNASSNRSALSFTITGLNLASGASFWIRWVDSDLIPNADDGLAIDDFALTPAGVAADSAPAVASTAPADGAMEVPANANLRVTFSEPVNVSGDWFTIQCLTSGAHAASVSGGPTTFSLNPGADFVPGEQCTWTILAANVADQDTNDPPDNLTSDWAVAFTALDPCSRTFTPIYAIQGSGLTPAITGPVTTRGIVVGDYEYPGAGTTSNYLRGFFLQDAEGDGAAATSDGIFVFNANNDSVQLGDLVYVTGNAADYQGQTQLSNVSLISVCGAGRVAPAEVTFPVPSSTYLEQYEGMLVRLPQTMVVTEHYQLGRFGQVVLSADGRLWQPTHLAAPGAEANALQAANDLNRIILDDATNVQNPDPIVFARGGLPLSASNTLRGGDTATGIVGVLNYTWAGNSASGNAYRVRPVRALDGYLNFEPANPRPTSAPDVGGLVQVADMNLLNFFNTFTGCTAGVAGAPTDCRGAYNAAEFARQWPKTVAAILAMDPDVLGVNELENDGYGPESALQFLVDRLNEATAPGTYAFIDVDARTGQLNALGTDGIKVSLLYKPAVVTPIGRTAALNTVAFVNGGDSEPRNRPSLAQAFQVKSPGAAFIVDINHLKSKGSACEAPDAGDGQGNCNAVRVNAAAELLNWLATDPTGTGDPDILLMGDLNSYALEDPVALIKGAGFTNLIDAFVGPQAYSYVFNGQWGYLDHALGSPSLVPQVTGVSSYHINADEPSVLDYNMEFKSAGQLAGLYAPDPFRVSDHDAVLVGLDLPAIGFVTGGGWIASPAGAYAADPALAGKATFGFVASYKDKAATPEGNLEFKFGAADLALKSTSYTWLVVAGSVARCEGEGTINGEGAYQFSLSVTDGRPDTFRMRIWTEDAGVETLIYDTGSELPSGGGSIVIHQ